MWHRVRIVEIDVSKERVPSCRLSTTLAIYHPEDGGDIYRNVVVTRSTRSTSLKTTFLFHISNFSKLCY
jgi:hypothetical protein